MLKTFPIEFVRQALEQTLQEEHMKDENLFGGKEQVSLLSFYEQLKSQDEVDRFVETFRDLTEQQNRTGLIMNGVLVSPENPTITNLYSSTIIPLTWSCSFRTTLANRDQVIVTLNNLIDKLKGKKVDIAQLRCEDENHKDYFQPFKVGTVGHNDGMPVVKNWDFLGQTNSTGNVDTFIYNFINNYGIYPNLDLEYAYIKYGGGLRAIHITRSTKGSDLVSLKAIDEIDGKYITVATELNDVYDERIITVPKQASFRVRGYTTNGGQASGVSFGEIQYTAQDTRWLITIPITIDGIYPLDYISNIAFQVYNSTTQTYSTVTSSSISSYEVVTNKTNIYVQYLLEENEAVFAESLGLVVNVSHVWSTYNLTLNNGECREYWDSDTGTNMLVDYEAEQNISDYVDIYKDTIITNFKVYKTRFMDGLLTENGTYKDIIIPPTNKSMEQYKLSMSFDAIRCDEPRNLNANEYCELTISGSATLVNEGVQLGNDLLKIMVQKQGIKAENPITYTNAPQFWLEPLEMPSGNNVNTQITQLVSNKFMSNSHADAMALTLQYTFIYDKNVNLLTQWFMFARYGIQGTNVNSISPNMEYYVTEFWSSWGVIDMFKTRTKIVENIDIENTESDTLTLGLTMQIQNYEEDE